MAEKDKCPSATQDIAVNIKNRQKAIKTADYGPLNPKESNDDFWSKKGKRWDVSSSEAKKQLCGNCVMFVKTPTMLDCIENGLGTEKSSHAWDIIETAGLGYCEAFDFKCAASRTCDAWVVGGPITDEKKFKEKSLDFEVAKLENIELISIKIKDDFENSELPEWGEDYSDYELMLDYDEKSLKTWFKEKWVDISRPKKGGGFEPCGRNDADKGKYPKCVPASKASKMTPEEISSAVRRKRTAESTQQRDDKKPINVSTSKKDAFSEDLEEKSPKPTNPELYARVKAEAKAKFDVYPSAYANAWLVREYKKRGGGYRSGKKELEGEYTEDIAELNEKQLSSYIDWMEEKSVEELLEEKKGLNPCWDGYKQVGMKKGKNGNMVPNCVPIGTSVKSDKPLKDPKGGLTAAGRSFFNRTQGSNLKPGVKGAADTPEKMRRKGSFLTRFFTNPSGPMVDEKGRATRLALSATAWGERVPKNGEDAAALAAKGRRLLERYENTQKSKKDAFEDIDVKVFSEMSDQEKADKYINSLTDDEFEKMFPIDGENEPLIEEKFLFGVGVAFARRAIMNRRKNKRKKKII